MGAALSALSSNIRLFSTAVMFLAHHHEVNSIVESKATFKEEEKIKFSC